MIEDKLLRFVIPFHFINSKTLGENAEWHRKWKKTTIVSGENDLYDYIVNLASVDDEKSVIKSWEWIDKNMLTKSMFCSEVDDIMIEWRITNVGVVLFDTEVGFLWYEIEEMTELRDIRYLHEFLYILKELSRGYGTAIYRKFSCRADDAVRIECVEGNDNISINEKLETKQGFIIKGRERLSFFKEVIYPFLEGLTIDTYFANRKTKEGLLVPDRGIPFLWLLGEPRKRDEQVVVNEVFRFGRCYNKQYTMPKNVKDAEFFRPFEDSIWYGCLEGCANYVFPVTKKEFYSNGYKSRIDTYFYLYLLNLGQYYSLLQLGTDVSELSTDENKYSIRNTLLEDMLDKIHIFNLKNMYSQVGHFTQHNEFCSYLRQRFSINEMHNELEKELQTLYEMIERKKTDRNARRYKVITIISGLFVGTEVFASIHEIVQSYYEGGLRLWLQMLISVGIMFGVALIGVGIWFGITIANQILDKKERKNYKKECQRET